MPKQRLKSATMNKQQAMQRGISRENHDVEGAGSQYEDGGQGQPPYHGYSGHVSTTGMPPVSGAQMRKKWRIKE